MTDQAIESHQPSPPMGVSSSEGLAGTAPTPSVQRLLWFTFDQNNSGGHFVNNESVCETVCIQAVCAADAIAKAKTICDNQDSCPCCGDRWSFWVEDSDGHAMPSIYGEPIESTAPTYFRKEARLHYIDGLVETIQYGTARPLPLGHDG